MRRMSNACLITGLILLGAILIAVPIWRKAPAPGVQTTPPAAARVAKLVRQDGQASRDVPPAKPAPEPSRLRETAGEAMTAPTPATTPMSTPTPSAPAASQPAQPAPQPPEPAAMLEVLAPLPIKLPPKLFIGTPPNMKLLNVAMPQDRPPFLAPRDAKLLSLHKEVTASDTEPIIGEIAMVTDGDKNGNDGSFVEFGPGVQWIQLDLGQPNDLYALVLWHYHAQARVYHDVIVRTADDPDFVTGVKTLFNNDNDNSAGLGVGKDKEYLEDHQGKLIDARAITNGEPLRARYIRCYSNGNTANEMNHYVEVEVYGRPAK